MGFSREVEGTVSLERYAGERLLWSLGQIRSEDPWRTSRWRRFLWGSLAGCMIGAVMLASAAGARAGAWSLQPIPAPKGPDSALSAVSCASSRACIAVGSTGSAGPLVERWNGKRWTVMHTLGIALGFDPSIVGLSAVSCSVAPACTAVGSDADGGPLIERWNGRGWSRQASSQTAS